MEANTLMTITNSNELLVYGKNMFTSFNAAGTTISEVPVEGLHSLNKGEVSHILKGTNVLFTGKSDGSLELRDPASLKIVNKISAHSGGISSVDFSNYSLVSCGYSMRHGQVIVDPIIKVFDIRAMKSSTPISCNISPTRLRFISSTKLLAASPTGSLQISNINRSQEVDHFKNVSVSGYLAYMEVSSSGIIALGDTFGNLTIFSGESGSVNRFSRNSAYIDTDPEPLPEMDDTRLGLVL